MTGHGTWPGFPFGGGGSRAVQGATGVQGVTGPGGGGGGQTGPQGATGVGTGSTGPSGETGPAGTPGGGMEQPGQKATNLLENLTTVSDGQTVTIGTDVYEVEVVNTASGNNTAGGDFNSVTSPLTVNNAVTTYPGVAFAPGKLIRIQSEIMRVSGVAGNNVTFLRAQSNTAVAAHPNGNGIFKGNGTTGSNIAVGLVTTLTAGAFVDALVADINQALGTEPFSGVAAHNGVACSHTLSQGTWAQASTFGGLDPNTPKTSTLRRQVSQAEVDAGYMSFFLDWSPAQVVLAIVFDVARPGVDVNWDGLVNLVGNRITLVDQGSVNWTTSSVVCVVVSA
jgi:hypothetical protein